MVQTHIAPQNKSIYFKWKAILEGFFPWRVKSKYILQFKLILNILVCFEENKREHSVHIHIEVQ